MAEVTISDLRNLTDGGSSLLFPVDGDDETFNISLSTVFEYIDERLGLLNTGVIEMYMGEVVADTHTELDGKSFDPLIFPGMGALFPNGILPDTRGMTLKHAPDGRSVLSFEGDAIKSHNHTASFSGNALPNHTHTMAHTHVHQKVVDFETSQTTGSTWPASIEIPNDGWSSRANMAGNSGSVISIRFNSEGRTTGNSSASTTGSGGSQTPSGSVAVNSSGSSKNLVDNIAVKFIIKKA